ncbi:MAG: 16S rRNA (guanine(966)-N(2))-methyltransferase RsmD [Oscillospiraceae bacterium]|nr:16S rRNA (guanine(966)-N(2))-methyltransferase RsmD [Oscillospiraceae bacterium]
MRVITGSARGHKLAAPEGLNTRPTTDMTKEAMFSIVQFLVEGSTVLDLFAGSGQLGIEALSRGAKRAVFIDSSREAQAVILANLRKTNLMAFARVAQMEAEAFLRTTQDKFDLVFLDPPYGQGFPETVLPMIADHVNPGGVILCETEKREILPDTAGDMTVKKEYFYGKSKVTTYRWPEEI